MATLGPGATLDPSTVAGLLLEAGATPDQAARLTAISKYESGYQTNDLNNTPPDYSVGLFQVNYYGDLLSGRTAAYGSPAQLAADPLAQAKAAVAISGGPGGTNFGPWTTNKSVTSEDLAVAGQAVNTELAQLGKGGLLNIPQFAQTFQAQGQAAASSLVDTGSPWHSVLLNLDGILNNKPDSNGLQKAIDLLNPISDLRVIVARSAVVLVGLTVTVFGLLVVVESIAGDSGVKLAAGAIPGGTFAAGALDVGGSASNAQASRKASKAEERREERHQEDMRRSDEKAQARRDRSRYNSARSKPKDEEPF